MRVLLFFFALVVIASSAYAAGVNPLKGVGPVVLIDEIHNNGQCKLKFSDLKRSIEFPIATSRLKVLDGMPGTPSFQMIEVRVELLESRLGGELIGCVSRIGLIVHYALPDGGLAVLWDASLIGLDAPNKVTELVQHQAENLAKELVVDWSKANPQ